MKNSVLLMMLATPFLVGASSAQSNSSNMLYDLDVSIVDNGTLYHDVDLKIALDEPVRIHVTNEPDGYSYIAEMAFSSAENGKVEFTSNWEVESPTSGNFAFAPEFTLALGEEGRIVRGFEGPGIKPLEITITLNKAAQ